MKKTSGESLAGNDQLVSLKLTRPPWRPLALRADDGRNADVAVGILLEGQAVELVELVPAFRQLVEAHGRELDHRAVPECDGIVVVVHRLEHSGQGGERFATEVHDTVRVVRALEALEIAEPFGLCLLELVVDHVAEGLGVADLHDDRHRSRRVRLRFTEGEAGLRCPNERAMEQLVVVEAVTAECDFAFTSRQVQAFGADEVAGFLSVSPPVDPFDRFAHRRHHSCNFVSIDVIPRLLQNCRK